VYPRTLITDTQKTRVDTHKNKRIQLRDKATKEFCKFRLFKSFNVHGHLTIGMLSSLTRAKRIDVKFDLHSLDS
jgi:hypothetical protein